MSCGYVTQKRILLGIDEDPLASLKVPFCVLKKSLFHLLDILGDRADEIHQIFDLI